MRQVWQPLLFAIGFLWCSWELWRGFAQGVVASRIREFRRSDQPGPFWLAMLVNLIVVAVCGWFLANWIKGELAE